MPAVMVEHTAILPFKPQNWMSCHQLSTLEDTIALMEAYGSAEAELHLVPKSWKKKGTSPGGGECKPVDQGGEEPK